MQTKKQNGEDKKVEEEAKVLCVRILPYVYFFASGSRKGAVVGGTQGNKILDFVSGAPVKETVVDQVPNVFDYDELARYGFGVCICEFIIFLSCARGLVQWKY